MGWPFMGRRAARGPGRSVPASALKDDHCVGSAWRCWGYEGFSDDEDFYPLEGEQVFAIMIWIGNRGQLVQQIRQPLCVVIT
jgi:hypothetical protein